MVLLNEVEARVLGVLIEKEITTPEYYPLSLNATLNACNQKSSREPVMELVEADVRTALFELDQMGLARTIADARVSKFEHRVRDVLNLRRDEVAVICLLLLRGPQTSAELRARTERMYSFDDNAAVITTLERLASREEPLTQLMQRQPGSREARWVHLLSGPVSDAVVARGGREKEERVAGPAVAEMAERMEELEELVRSLEERVARLEVAAEGSWPARP
jgi:uncharacterized protein YceH (UPF0502 family)